MSRIALLTLILLVATGQLASGQSLTKPGDVPPVVGGAGGLRPPERSRVLGGTPNATAKVHLAPTGKPCVHVDGYSKAQTLNPNIFDHFISATNTCSLRIKLQVCYYKTQHCIPVEIGAYDRKEAVLGIFPALKEFRYEYTEKF
jgi:hypothetical protein